MNNLIVVTLIGLFTGVVGTAGGGLLALTVRKLKNSFLSTVLGFSAGIMTVVVFFDLLPEALDVGTLWTSLLGLILGIGLIAILDINFPHQHFSSQYDGDCRMYKTGLLLALGIALHNIPEGLAIGAGYSSNTSLGLGIAILIAIQNMPEGMAVVTALCLGGLKNIRTLVITALAGVPMGLGAFFGNLLGNVNSLTLSISLGFAAGAMLYIIFDELVPEAHERTEGHLAIGGTMVGVITGLILSSLI